MREKPQFIKRTRDKLLLSDANLMIDLPAPYEFTATVFSEPDGSVTLPSNELDLVENAPTEREALDVLSRSILDYAEEFYDNFSSYSAAPNRKSHVPYILKALLSGDADELCGWITCLPGKN